MLRRMIGNWIRNSVKASSLDQLELKRSQYAYFDDCQSKFICDGPAMIKLILDMVNPEARVNVRELKDKIKQVKIEDFEGNVPKMLTHMQLIYECILSENDTHEDFHLDLMTALNTVHDKKFLGTIERIQDDYDDGVDITPLYIINRATTKYNHLLNRNSYFYKEPQKKYLNFSTDGGSKSTASTSGPNLFLRAIPE